MWGDNRKYRNGVLFLAFASLGFFPFSYKGIADDHYVPPSLFAGPKPVVLKHSPLKEGPPRPLSPPAQKKDSGGKETSETISVYERDPENGGFKRVLSPDQPSVKTSDRLDLPRVVQMKSPKGHGGSFMPAVPPDAVSAVPLDAAHSDINKELLAMPDTSLPAPAPSTAGAPILTTNPHILLPFKEQITSLDAEQKGRIDDNVLKSLQKDISKQIDILAFAAPAKDEPERDQRVALARGLSVRDYLISKGIDPARLTLQVMGKNTLQLPFDRVEIAFK